MKNCFFSNIHIYIFSTITFQFSNFICRRHLLLFNGVLFAQETPKELILLCMDYDIALRFQNAKSQK